MEKVDKPWGYEIWFAQTDKYIGKLLFIEKGGRLSLQYHKVKDETLYVLSGLARFTISNLTVKLKKGDVVHIPPLTKHRVEAIRNTFIIEVSTPEISDVVRLKDDYGRI